MSELLIKSIFQENLALAFFRGGPLPRFQASKSIH